MPTAAGPYWYPAEPLRFMQSRSSSAPTVPPAQPERVVSEATIVPPVSAAPPARSTSRPSPRPTPISEHHDQLAFSSVLSRQSWTPPPTPAYALKPTHTSPVGSVSVAGSEP